jgi:hypothetical protein
MTISKADARWWDEYAQKHGLAGWREPDDPPPGLAGFNPQRWIADQRWKFAASMPDHPHWYVMLHFVQGNLDDFLRMFYVIRRDGHDEQWGKRTYRYLQVGAYDYWPMSVTSPPGAIINRRLHRPPLPEGQTVTIGKPERFLPKAEREARQAARRARRGQ